MGAADIEEQYTKMFAVPMCSTCIAFQIRWDLRNTQLLPQTHPRLTCIKIATLTLK